ncbi:MAG: 3-hydroxyacyl-CoA dehydrogenase NAD-binding domain-containing protein, partial [Nocardioidaceae bacterium]
MSGHDDGQPGWTPLLVGPVLVVGAGLIGTSIGLALTRRHLDVYLVDVEPTAAHVAASRGAGREGLP